MMGRRAERRDPSPEGCVLVSDKGRRWLSGGHPWVYRNDLVDLSGVRDGDFVAVRDRAQRHLGWGLFSGASRIAVRLVTRGDAGTVDGAPDRAFFIKRVEVALERRRELSTRTEALRLIHGEADGFPALVVDRYGRYLVVQATATGAERLLEWILETLVSRFGARGVVARHDLAVRDLEGLPREVRLVRGVCDESPEVLDDGLVMPVDLLQGQKTGLYLDQRDNRSRVRALGPFGRVLDAFCYQGSFGLSLAGCAEEVIAVDSSLEALERGRRAAELNSIRNVTFERAKVFEDLKVRELKGELFDLVLLDPPAFAKSRADLRGALRGYRELNRRAMKLVRRGGWLVTSSCSYNLDEATFLGLLRAGAARSGQSYHVVARGRQADDHPILLGLPESAYLKTFYMRRVD